MSDSAASAAAGRGSNAERLCFAIAATGLLVAAGLFWSAFVAQGAPYVYHPDEPAVVARALRMVETGDLNPRWFRYPSLVLYLQAATAAVAHAVTGRLVAPGTEILFEGARASVVAYYIAGRGVTVAFAVLTMLLTMFLARRMAGPWIGLLAGAAFAASPLALSSAVFVTVDMPLTFFAAAATLLCIRAVDSGPPPGPALFAATVACAALGAGAKYNGVVLLAPFIGVFLLRRGPSARSFAELFAYALLAIVVFVATTPYSLLDPHAFWSTSHGLPAELIHYRAGHLGHDEGSSLAKALRVALGAIGWLAPFALFGVMSVFILPGSDPRVRAGRVVLASLVVLAIPVALARVFFERNCLPFLPLLLALAAFGVRRASDSVTRFPRSGTGGAFVAIALVAVLLILEADAALSVVKAARVQRAEMDVRTIAHQWAVAHIPPGSRILRESFTPHLHLESSFVVHSVFALGQLPSLDALGAHDYVVTSDIWRSFPDFGATPYATLFSRPPVFESAAVGDFVIRIHHLGEDAARP